MTGSSLVSDVPGGDRDDASAWDASAWDVVDADPDESHGMADLYPRTGQEPEGAPLLIEQPPAGETTPPRPTRRALVKALGLVAAIALGLAKLALLVVISNVELRAAHAGIATDVLVYGLVLLVSGFMMRWTTWAYGLGQVLWPDLYDEIGLWLLRLGIAMAFVGALAVVVIEYIA